MLMVIVMVVMMVMQSSRFYKPTQGPEKARGSPAAKKGSLPFFKKGAFNLLQKGAGVVFFEAGNAEKRRSLGLLLPHPC